MIEADRTIDGHLTLDTNHPLPGMNLDFELTSGSYRWPIAVCVEGDFQVPFSMRLSLGIILQVGFLMASVGLAATNLPSDHDYDPDNGRDINGLCAGCHGEFGQGGGDGEYPRLAGMSAKYLANQLMAFKNRDRSSIAMAVYATDRELPAADLLDVSIFLSEVELFTRMPDVDPDMAALDKLLIARMVFNVRAIAGDTAAGRDIYDRKCRKCHGEGGVGRGSTPQLTGQFSEYLRRQIADFQSGERRHKSMRKSIQSLTVDDIEALLAYLSVADD